MIPVGIKQLLIKEVCQIEEKQALACSKVRSHLDLCLLIGWTYIDPIRAQLYPKLFQKQ